MIKHLIQFLGGAHYNISPFLTGEDELSLTSNVVISYKLGAILKRLGYSQVGDTLQADKSITGLHNFRQNSATQKILATVNNSAGTNLTLKYNNSGTWTDISLSSAWDGYEDAEVDMEDFIGYCFLVGYDSTDGIFLPVGSLTGTTFSTSTNVTDMPQGKYIIRYRDRLYVLNCYYNGSARPYRVYYSSVPSSGSITWTPASDFLDVDFSEAITGGNQNWDKMLIFTEYSAYMYNQNEWKKVWDIGCIEHRTIKNSGAYMIWTNRDGVWMSSGGRPINISGKVQDFVKAAISAGNKLFAEVIDEEYRLNVGNVTVDGIGYTNCSIIFNIPTQTWRVEEYYDTPTIFARYNSSGDDRLYMGMSDGEVMEMSKYSDSSPVYADDGNDIDVLFETKALDFDRPEERKQIEKVLFYADRAQDLNVKAMIVDKNTRALNKIINLGTLNDYTTEFSPREELKGHFIKFLGSESSSLPYFSLFGLSIKYNIEDNF